MFGSRGPAGQIGSNASGSPVGRSSTLGSSNSMGLSGQALSGSGMGFNSFGSQTSTMGNAATIGQGAFIGRQDANTGRFTGNQQAGQQGTNRSNTGRTARTGGARRTTNENNFNSQNFQNFGNQGGRGNRSGSASRMNIRPQQRIAFSFPGRDATSIESTLDARFGSLASRQAGFEGVTVSSEADGVIVLTGEVDSEESRRLAAVVARLEPGVRSVRNELTVREAE
jgi:hypothetical protein